MKRPILFLCTLALLTGFSIHELSAQTQVKPKATAIADSIQKYSVIWTTDSILVALDIFCTHDWQTVPGSERQRQYLDKKGVVSDSLTRIYNPNSERVIQQICTKCKGQRFRSEHITVSKLANPLKAK